MDISIVTNLTKWCTQSDWPVHPLILARHFAVYMVICCPVPRLCSSDWLDAHPYLIHHWAQLTDSSLVSTFIVLCHLCKLGQCIPYFGFQAFQSACLTLEIRSRSPKLFPNSQCVYAKLIKIHPLVQKIMHGNPILDISKCRCDLEN